MSARRRLRARADLEVRPRAGSGESSWVVKDPLTMRYYVLGADEMSVLRLLDGERDLEGVHREHARRSAPRRPTAAQVWSFAAALCEQNLAVVEARGEAARLLESRGARQRRERWAGLANFLSIRFPGVDPSAFLDAIYPWLRWCFTWRGAATFSAVIAYALYVLAEHGRAFATHWAFDPNDFNAARVVWVMAVLAVAKVAHELGHAVTCKHFGGACSELGAMLLVFTPCLYCNVTDSWMIASRWRRIAISAAGVVVDLFFAAVGVVVWRHTEPGFAHDLAASVALVCGVGSVLFNANPLMRYDGYFVLSDLVRVPNLWSESRERLARCCKRYLLLDQGTADQDAAGWWLIGYAIASIAYRVVLTGVILLLLYRLFAVDDTGALFVVTASAVGLSAVGPGAVAAIRWVRSPIRRRKVRSGRAAIVAVAALAAVAAVFVVPLPCGVTAPAVVEARDARRVYATAAGELVECTAAGRVVAKGEVVARLENRAARLDQLRLRGEVARFEARVDALESRRGDDRGLVASRLALAQEVLTDLRRQLALRDDELARLNVVAPCSGVVIAPPSRPAAADTAALATWSGAPLDRGNLGCTLEAGDMICVIGDPRSIDAVLYVDEESLPFVRPGQRARVTLDLAPAAPLSAHVREVSGTLVDALPVELVVDGRLPNHPTAESRAEPTRPCYQVRVAIDDADLAVVGAVGWGRVAVDGQTLAHRVARWVRDALTTRPPAAGR
ncbi:MAG: HlyD family efflux transporter periplasmic adaptor subunit [Lacipirellulaceae bacterium]